MNKKLRILHLEDSFNDSELVYKALKKEEINFERKLVDTKDAFIAALQQFLPDIILSTHSIPSLHSFEALTILSQTKLKIPFILITNNGSAEFAIDCIHQGADDYILKHRLEKLPAAIDKALHKYRLENEQQSVANNLILEVKRFQALIEYGDSGMAILSADWKPIYQTTKKENLLGYSSEDFFNFNLFHFIHPDDLLSFKNLLSLVKENPGKQVKTDGIRFLHKDGRWLWIEGSLTNLLNDSTVNGVAVNFRNITDRKLAQEQVLLNEYKFRRLIENSTDAIAILSADGKPTYISPSIKNVMGYTAEEALNLDLFDLVHPDDAHYLTSFIGKAMASPGIAIVAETIRMLHHDGSWLWMEGIFTNMLDDPAINGIVDNFRNITKRILAEQKMKESEERYRMFFENSMDGILLTQQNGKILAANPAACHIFQMTESEIYEVGKFGLIDPSDPRALLSIQYRKIYGKSKGELSFIRKDGSKFLGEVTSVDYLDSQGEECTSTIIRDISERKAAELEVLKVYEEKNVILESIGDAFFAINANWKVNYWNKEAEKLLDCPRHLIINKNIWTIFPNELNTPFYPSFQKAFKENAIQHFETLFEKTNKWLEVTVYPSVNGLSVYFTDITERKLSNLRLMDLNQNLQTYTRELVISNKELEQFSYILSHNLRSPVANIMGITEELKDLSHTEETVKMLKMDLGTCVNILNDMLIDLNSILTVKKEISERKKRVNLCELITDIKTSIHKLIESKQVQIRVNFNELNEVVTLKSYLYSIVFNLISNSIKYQQPGVHPIIELKSEIVDNNFIITYKDNGMGIDLDKHKNQVFGLYKRFHQNIEGKGMGLFMVKTQVETLKGKITIQSEVNKGVEFVMTFPIED